MGLKVGGSGDLMRPTPKDWMHTATDLNPELPRRPDSHTMLNAGRHRVVVNSKIVLMRPSQMTLRLLACKGSHV
eukprot:222991-Chlamydomonas_euryale.AAC.3